MKSIAILLFLSIALIGADFKPIDFKGYGMKEPQMRFVLNSEESVRLLRKSDTAVFVDVRQNEKVPLGISLNIDRYLIENPTLVNAAASKKLIEMISNPLNYGDAQPELAHSKKKIEVVSALEITDGNFFIRMYFDKELEYAWFFGQRTGNSPIWKISPDLAAILKKAQGEAMPIDL